jgi:N-acetylmuramic acid 6-phosphate (MurNAc-6-P) etherase
MSSSSSSREGGGAAPRITELPNPVTADIDVASFEGLVRLLGTSDAQLFSGYAGLPGLFDDETIASVARVCELVADALRHPFGRVVFSGCGTSGRLSHLEALSLNRVARARGLAGNDRFAYLLAGGDAALLLAQEAAEDQGGRGKGDLVRFLGETAAAAAAAGSAAPPVVVVGISCGLSAAYVGSMLDHALSARAAVSGVVAIGFNPVEGVRGVRVEGWDRTFHDVLAAMAEEGQARAVVLNPIVGPESIAGSSRMKGGSATKILVETIGAIGVHLATTQPAAAASAASASALNPGSTAAAVRACFQQYEAAVRHVSFAVPAIANLIRSASAAVTTQVDPAPAATAAAAELAAGTRRRFVSPTGRGRILYVGVGTAGLLGLIDASECSPTYGSLYNDVRGFLGGGWDELANAEGVLGEMVVPRHGRGDAALATGPYAEPVALGVADGFLQDMLPTLGPADLVVFLAIVGDGTEAAEASTSSTPALSAEAIRALEGVEAARAKGCTVRHIVVGKGGAPDAPSPAAEPLLAALRRVVPDGLCLWLPSTALELPLGGPGGGSSAAGAAASSSTTSPVPQHLAELVLKLVLNATTTGAHIRKGTIYRNRMINLCLTNAKLFHRAVGIAGDVAGCAPEAARRSVLRAIYRVDDDARVAELDALPVLSHVSASSSQINIVPLAILLAADEAAAAAGGKGKGTGGTLRVAEAVAALEAEPVIRRAIARALSGKGA